MVIKDGIRHSYIEKESYEEENDAVNKEPDEVLDFVVRGEPIPLNLETVVVTALRRKVFTLIILI